MPNDGSSFHALLGLYIAVIELTDAHALNRHTPTFLGYTVCKNIVERNIILGIRGSFDWLFSDFKKFEDLFCFLHDFCSEQWQMDFTSSPVPKSNDILF